MLQAELSSWSCADEGRRLNRIHQWRRGGGGNGWGRGGGGGARDIQGELSQKVRLIKSKEVPREPELPTHHIQML